MKDINKINSETWLLCVCVFSAFFRGGWYMKRRSKRQKEKRKMRRKRRRALTKAFCYRHTTLWRGWRSSCTRSECHVHLSHTHINFAAETQLTHHKHRWALSLSLYVEGHMVRLNRWHQRTWHELSAHSRFCTNMPQSINTENIPAKPDAHLLAPAASHLNLAFRVCHMQRNRNWKPSFVACAVPHKPAQV